VKLEAFPYQSEAVQAIRELEYSAILFEQGLGKSKIAIDLMMYWLEKKMVDTILYVAKKSLIHNCEKEFERHSFLKPKILTQNRSGNYFVFNTPSRLVLTHYEVLKSEFDRLKLFLRVRNVAVILDESAKIKNPDSSVAQAAFALSPLFTKRVIMTGTPVANRPYDIWAQIYFLDQGQSLGHDFVNFKNQADLTKKLHDDQNERDRFESFIGSIFSRIAKFCIRQTKTSGIIHLPQKEYRTIYANWEPHQYETYSQIREEMRTVIIKEGIPIEDKSDQVLKRLLRLVQIASNPALVDESYKATPGKYEPLCDIVTDICSQDEKCIIWTSFVENANWLSKELRYLGTAKIHGKMNIADRNREVDKFMENRETKILVATPGAAKEGLTLTAANHVIYFDRVFSLDDYLQSQDRIHRISQNKKCFVYNLIMKDSIDEWIDVLLQAKHLAAQLAQGDISLEYYKSQASYDFAEIIRNILDIKSH
jgi:SNF2 family DNA or RNA helicase